MERRETTERISCWCGFLKCVRIGVGFSSPIVSAVLNSTFTEPTTTFCSCSCYRSSSCTRYIFLCSYYYVSKCFLWMVAPSWATFTGRVHFLAKVGGGCISQLAENKTHLHIATTFWLKWLFELSVAKNKLPLLYFLVLTQLLTPLLMHNGSFLEHSTRQRRLVTRQHKKYVSDALKNLIFITEKFRWKNASFYGSNWCIPHQTYKEILELPSVTFFFSINLASFAYHTALCPKELIIFFFSTNCKRTNEKHSSQ